MARGRPIATATADGGSALVVSLSFGERGESGELWKEPGQTLENVKEIRRGEAEAAAAILGAEIRFLDKATIRSRWTAPRSPS